MKESKTAFRYDINALRAIAVVGVLLFHYKIFLVKGGFAGVDVFFVISGFLMSQIIIIGIEKKNFSLLGFYEKRVKRIMPALLATVLVVSLIGFFIFFPDSFMFNEKASASSLLFFSNIVYWKNSGYFDPNAESNPLLHTWSLSVEWQFYLIYPIILLAICKAVKQRKYLLAIFAIATGLLFLFSALYSKKDHNASFYLLPTRAWEMLFGGMAFLCEGIIKKVTVRKFIAIIGYLLIFVSFNVLNNQMRWPGKFTLIPVVSTFIILVSHYDFNFLRNKLVQFIGKVSYSWYLWHWPLYVIVIYFGWEMNVLSIVILILTSLFLAFLSFKFIESGRFKTYKILVFLGFLTLLTGLTAFNNFNYWVFKSRALQLASYKSNIESVTQKQFSRGNCFVPGLEAFNKNFCVDIMPGKKNILLVGDSHAAQYSQTFREAFSRYNIHICQATASLCLPIIRKNGAQDCSNMMNYIYYDFIAKNSKKIDGIIICANWVSVTDNYYPQLLRDINSTFDYLNKMHIKTVIIGQNKTYTIPYSIVLAKEYQYGVKLNDRYLNPASLNINNYLKRNLGNKYIDVYQIQAPSILKGNTPFIFDENHLSKPGADLVTNNIMQNASFRHFLGL